MLKNIQQVFKDYITKDLGSLNGDLVIKNI